MSTEILLSGAFGALLATVVSIAVSIWREQVRRRSDVAVEVITWIEEVRATRQQYFTARTLLEGALSGKHQQSATRWEARWNAIGDKLIMLANSRVLVAKVALSYGQGSLPTEMEELYEAVSSLVLQEIKALEIDGLVGLESEAISTLRRTVDSKKDSLTVRLVKAGSVNDLLREAWEEPSRE